MHTKERTYPTQCPACQKVNGYPKIVTTVKNDPTKLSIGMCCLSCKHEWEDLAVLRPE